MDFKEVIKAAQDAGAVREVQDGRFIVLPAGSEVHDLERFLYAPLRKRGRVAAHDPECFVAYYNRHKGEGSVIFADLGAAMVTGVLDHHAPVDGDDGNPEWAPGFREHVVAYAAPHSPEWLVWVGRHDRLMGQEEFAQFIEDNVVDVREPPGAEMLEVARRFEAKVGVAFRSAVRLESGAREFGFEETVTARAGEKGVLRVPERFVLGIPVFLNGPAYAVEARLRYRIGGGKLAIGYSLHRHEQVKADAFKAVVGAIAEGTATPVWYGAAE